MTLRSFCVPGAVTLLILSAAITPSGARAELTIARNGHSHCVIVAARQASPAVRHTAEELQQDLKIVTGALLPIVSDPGRRPAIFVGTGPALTTRGETVPALPSEGFVIRQSGNHLVLAGSDDRGTLYAVYTFLEEHAGVRWYAPDATLLPYHSLLHIRALNETQAPAFAYRDTDEHIVFSSPEWDAHLKLDGEDVPDHPELGGVNRLFNGAENFYDLVPPAKYFATHPEYYSLLNGKRTAAGGSQLCLTNPDVKRIVTEALIAQAKADPKLLTLGLSPNDATGGNCQCDVCRASDARYGAPSGTLLQFVNDVATAVQKALPDRKIWVETLAYQYTEAAPRPGTISPASNVLVCLAPIFACEAHPLATDPPNRSSRDALLAWSQIAPGHLQVWHYVTNFANYLQPFPDWDELAADMPYYRAHGVSGMFCEGDYNSPGAMTTLRTYVLAHLFWNPDQPVWPLIQDFCAGYYGAGGKYIYNYLRTLNSAVQQPGVHLRIYDGPSAAYLSPALLSTADGLFQQALGASKTPAERARVEEARLSIRYVELMQHVPGATSSPAEKTTFRQQLASLVGDLHRFDIEYTSEGGPTARWVARMEKAAA